MPKVTYPRPCPTCGKELRRPSSFSRHKKHCGTFEHRFQCPLCPLSFSYLHHKQWHVRQQHSKTPLRFPCTICEKVFTGKQKLKLHLETVHGEEKPRFQCLYCNATFAWKDNRQRHMRRAHGRVCREEDANLKIHLQHLSESSEFQNEWQLVEARPVQPGEGNICPCGQTELKNFFFLKDKLNGNRTFVGSRYAVNIDPEAEMVIDYFKHLLKDKLHGIYKGQDSQGLQRFEVNADTVLVQGLHAVQQLKPQGTKNCEGDWEVAIKHSKPTLLVTGQTFCLRLKMSIKDGQLTFTAL